MGNSDLFVNHYAPEATAVPPGYFWAFRTPATHHARKGEYCKPRNCVQSRKVPNSPENHLVACVLELPVVPTHVAKRISSECCKVCRGKRPDSQGLRCCIYKGEHMAKNNGATQTGETQQCKKYILQTWNLENLHLQSNLL